MSLILCKPETIKHPYFIESLGIHVFSIEELCYVIYQHPLLVMDEFINESLLQFLREELKMEFLAGRLEQWKKSEEPSDEMLLMILQSCTYYTSKEIHAYGRKLAGYRKMSKAELQLEFGDYYYSLKQYGRAIHAYEKIFEITRAQELSSELLGTIWSHIAASYAAIFWYEKAMSAYEMAYNYKKTEALIKKMYQLTLFQEGLVMKERYQTYLTEERTAPWKQEVEQVLEDADESEEMKQLIEIENLEAEKRKKSVESLVRQWKQDYRKI